jgi:hypothetical protein
MAALCKGTLGFKAAQAGKISDLLLSLSSHGTQMADTHGDEPDGMDAAFVPTDIAHKGNLWDPARRNAKAAKAAKDRAADLIPATNQILWAGCKSNETSADAYFNGRYNGAFTYYFLQTMNATQNQLSRKAVVAKMRTAMSRKFAQTSQLEGNAGNRQTAVAN